jgi:hypothetical protein
VSAAVLKDCSATVAGTINPEGLETSYELDLGIDTTYGTSIYGEAGSGSAPTEVTVSLQNLAPGTTYHYRMVAINSDGRSSLVGADRTFTTPAYNNPITQPFTAPLIPTPATAFPTDTTNTAKPVLAVVSHTLHGHTLTLKVYVPGAGKLHVAGTGLSATTKSAHGPGTLTITLHVKNGHRFKTKLKLTFTPTTGHKQTKSISIRA